MTLGLDHLGQSDDLIHQQGSVRLTPHKAQPHAAILYICDGTFLSLCNASKSPAMLCDAFSNMLEILHPILEYLS